jgi:hypothetical protein
MRLYEIARISPFRNALRGSKIKVYNENGNYITGLMARWIR